jgi:hypothetical protein
MSGLQKAASKNVNRNLSRRRFNISMVWTHTINAAPEQYSFTLVVDFFANNIYKTPHDIGVAIMVLIMIATVALSCSLR